MIRTLNFMSYGQSYSVVPALTAATVAVAQPTGAGYSDLMVYNSGTAPVFLAFGNSVQANPGASATSPDWVAPGAIQIINCNIAPTSVSIYGAGGGSVLFSVGRGS